MEPFLNKAKWLENFGARHSNKHPVRSVSRVENRLEMKSNN